MNHKLTTNARVRRRLKRGDDPRQTVDSARGVSYAGLTNGGNCNALIALVTVVCCCFTSPVYIQAEDSVDPLPSWRDTQTKKRIVDFVRSVTTVGDVQYVAPKSRVVTIDHDGTLWCEKPLVVQWIHLAKHLSQAKVPAVNAGGTKELQSDTGKDEKKREGKRPKSLGFFVIFQRALDTFQGMTPEAFSDGAAQFLDVARHSRFKTPYTHCVYQPMLELVDWLKENEFEVYIVTGGSTGFVRVFSEEVYGIERSHVIGTSPTYHWRENEIGEKELVRGFVESLNLGVHKPLNIQRQIGRRPILAIGNSDGDIEMLEYAQFPHSDVDRDPLCIVIRHDDKQREYQYDTVAKKIQALAQQKNWCVVSMKRDFETMFPLQN